jgi:NDP-sugar pyrophosphorylase family protein
MKQAMIFAAGLGTRLKPLTDTMPKALVRVGGQPLIWHVIQKLKSSGYERIVVNVHHFADQIVTYLEENHNFGLDIRISDETSALLETGGGIKKALPLFDANEPILIHNVDILSNLDLEALPMDAPLLVVSERQTKRYLMFDDEMRLHGWTNIETGALKGPISNGQWSMVRSSSAGLQGKNGQLRKLAFSGIHVFHPSLVPLLDEWPDRFPIMDFYLKACGTHLIRGYEAKDLRLLDVGKLDTLDNAEKFIKSL